MDAPFALVDLDAIWANAARDARAGRAGTPIRVASKSVRCRALLEAILERDGFRGLMTFTLPESLWLHEHGFDDLLLAYPTADRGALAELGRLDAEGAPILMVDSTEQLDLIESAAGQPARPIRVCIELDVSWWPLGGRVKIGAKRSPVRTPEQARALAHEIVRRPGFELAGADGLRGAHRGARRPPARQARCSGRPSASIKRRSAAEIAERRAAVVAAVREVAPVPIVNGGGTGSLHTTSAGGRDHGGHGRLRLLRAHAVRPLRRLHAHPGGDVRPAGGAAAERAEWPRCSAAATTRPVPPAPTACPSPTSRRACGSTPSRALARCRPR